MAVPQTQSLRVFGDAAIQALGNPCQLTQFDQKPSRFPTNTSSVTHCYSWPLDANVQEVCCLTAGGQFIQCCGHGLLASAAIYLQHQGLSSCTLKMGDSYVACHRDHKDFWLHFNRLFVRECDVPGWVSQIFQERPHHAALAGDNKAYLILEWPENYPLQELTTPNSGLKCLTDRALIVTAHNRKEHISFRYFAPQYGVNEDAATGSAMRILADYWFQRRGYDQLTARQCSPEGGRLFSRLRGELVEVGGSVEAMEE